MKAIMLEKPNVIGLKEVAIPVPPPGFVRVKVMASAVCATDLEVIDGGIPARYPLIPGHEWSGIADQAGSAEDHHWIGKRVIGSNDVVCLRCDACRSGNWRYCKDFEEIGFKRDGAYAEYVVVPSYGLCELPGNVSFEEGALCEPMGVALGTLEKSCAKFGDTLLIFGAGSIGLCILSAAKAMGLRRIVVCASGGNRRAITEKMGAQAFLSTRDPDFESKLRALQPNGADVVIDATGIEECIKMGLNYTKKGGYLVLSGYGRGKIMQISMDDIHINNLHVVGAGNNWNKLGLAVSLLADGVLDLSPLVTNKMRLEDFAEALQLARTRPEGFVKAVFVP